MINQQLLQPESIVVIGGSNNVHQPVGDDIIAVDARILVVREKSE